MGSRVTIAIAAVLFLVAACAIDSDSIIPLIVAIASVGYILLMLVIKWQEVARWR